VRAIDVSPDVGPKFCTKMIHTKAFEKALSKCGKHISRIIYKGDPSNYEPLCWNIIYDLLNYIATYCFNVTSLDLSAAHMFPSELMTLAQKCKKIKQLCLLISAYSYEDGLTVLFEENKDLEDITLYTKKISIVTSLMRLPEHKMKAITLKCDLNAAITIDPRILSSVSII